ncbi:MAG: hypothetical protein ABGY75_08895 [Gemmataceae bacterium]
MNLTLTERRTVIRPLPRAVAATLAERYSHLVEVRPTFARRRYALTARGYVGFLRVGEHTIEFRPKWPWERVGPLFSPLPAVGEGPGVRADIPAGFLDLFAHRLARLMLDRSAAGLHRGYVERTVCEPTVRGRIDLPAHTRAPWKHPGLFDQLVDDLSPDVPANRWPKATATELARTPGLSGATREVLERAVAAFAEVGDAPVPTADRDAIRAGAPAEYREMLDWCGLLDAGEVLVSLERAFEMYATRLFREAVGERNLRVQQPIHLTPVALTPDLVVRRGDTPVSVWDAKWKRPDPAADDLHQALAYAALLGVADCGLVYPGRRFRLETLRAAGSAVAVHLLRLPLADDPARFHRTAVRLRRACRPCRRGS